MILSIVPVCLLALTTACFAAQLSLDAVGSQITKFKEQHENPRFGASSHSGCQLACSFLDFVAPQNVFFASDSQYVLQQSHYYSQQQSNDTHPLCRVAPKNAHAVSFTLLVLRYTECQFAVKSGGHATFVGGSNINNGVTIDLVNLNTLAVSEDKKKTSIGSGNLWVDVYKYLDPQNLTVIGGRVGDIGTGGLTLGGGINFFSTKYGMACDNVISYEIVLADGSIKEVSYLTNPDLFFALRGGGNNFGIVTRFDVETYPQGKMWGGMSMFGANAGPALINAFINYNLNVAADPNACIIVVYGYYPVLSQAIWFADIYHADPAGYPAILQNFTSIPGAFTSTLRVDSIANYTLEFEAEAARGARQSFWTLTVKNDAQLFADIIALYDVAVVPIKNVTGLFPAISFQSLSPTMSSHFSKNGGNALGVSPDDGPLMLINLAWQWSLPSDDALIIKTVQNLVSQVNSTAYERGLGHRFLYQNYAALQQDVFPSYGAENHARLKSIAAKYDPEGVFTKLQPGYFKL